MVFYWMIENSETNYRCHDWSGSNHATHKYRSSNLAPLWCRNLYWKHNTCKIQIMMWEWKNWCQKCILSGWWDLGHGCEIYMTDGLYNWLLQHVHYVTHSIIGQELSLKLRSSGIFTQIYMKKSTLILISAINECQSMSYMLVTNHWL